MTIIFTEEEKKWISMEKFKWSIKDECPDKIKKSLKKKIDLLYDRKQTMKR